MEQGNKTLYWISSYWNLEIQIAFRKGYLGYKFYMNIKKEDSKRIIDKAYDYLRKDPEKWNDIVEECKSIKKYLTDELKDIAVDFIDYGVVVENTYENRLKTIEVLSKYKYVTSNSLEYHELLPTQKI